MVIKQSDLVAERRGNERNSSECVQEGICKLNRRIRMDRAVRSVDSREA